MSDSTAALQAKLTHLERHVDQQDAEFYRLSQRVDALGKVVEAQRARIDSLSTDGDFGQGSMPADEKPPHY